jgi:hypothetical protein
MAKPVHTYNTSMVDEHTFAVEVQSAYERRSGVERRIFSYSWHIPERRSGIDKRKCGKKTKTIMAG